MSTTLKFHVVVVLGGEGRGSQVLTKELRCKPLSWGPLEVACMTEPRRCHKQQKELITIYYISKSHVKNNVLG